MTHPSGHAAASRRKALCLALAAALVAGNLAAHKPISDLCDRWFVVLGRAAYEVVALLAIGLACAAAVIVLLWKSEPRPGSARLALLGLGVLTVAAERWLLVSNVELIHFPQFALLAALLLAAGVPPRRTFLIASAAGILDEVYQWLFIYAGVPHTYLDFNDMLLNAMGAAWAVLLWPVALPKGGGFPSEGRLPWFRVGLALAVPFLLYLDPPRLVPFLGRAMTGRAYRVLTAGETLGTWVVIWLMIVSVRSTSRRATTVPGGTNPDI